MFLAVPAVLAVLELVRWPARAELDPPIGLSFRAATGLDDRLGGPGTSVYRAQPEILLGLHRTPDLDVFAGGGVGPAYVVRPPGRGEGFSVTASGTVGLRFPVDGARVLAIARVDGLGGGGVTITVDLQLTFDR
jgi:hypothetical protein